MTASSGRSGWLERLCVLMLLLFALFQRARDLRAPFDREFEGAQAAFFAIGAINYERLGWLGAGGYPVINIDLGPRGDMYRDLRLHPASWYVYANHPPLVPLLAWSAVRIRAGEEWARACAEARAPRGIEPWIRSPFLCLNLLGLLGLWWAVRQAAGARRAMLALALASLLPISVIYGPLVNYENPVLLPIVLAAGFCARWMRGSKPRDLALCALAFATTGAVTYAGAFFVPALATCVWWRLGWRRAAGFASITGAAVVVALALHAIWSAHSLARLGLDTQPLFSRARELMLPLFDGTRPIAEWAGLQFQRVGVWFSWPIVLVALLGLVLHLIAAPRQRRIDGTLDEQSAIDLEPALFAGGALYLLAFYRHTFDPQFPFLMLLAPGVAGLAALALDRAADLLGKSRARTTPLILVVSLLALFAVRRANDLRFEFRAPAGLSRTGLASPSLPMPDVNGAEIALLLAPGGFGIHPAGMGLNLAVSFYAWRSLWPASAPSDTLPSAVAERFGLGGAPRVLLLPKHPWPAIAAEVSALEHEWVKDLAPDRESEHWRAWDLH